MDHARRPNDPASAAAVVARTVTELDMRTRTQSDVLLRDLLCAAWGSVVAQNQ
jgi:hypothetical protein